MQTLVKENKFIKCKNCSRILVKNAYQADLCVCTYCGYHGRLSAEMRIKQIADLGSFRELYEKSRISDPLHFPGYKTKLEQLQRKYGIGDAIKVGTGMIGEIFCAFGAMDTRFMMASMGVVVGEKITKIFEYATEKNLPVVLFSASGGARMQEGMFSLMQMAKTAAAVANHHKAGNMFISVLTDPVTGGVAASFAMLGDVMIAEPGAMIGFAGKRVIQETLYQDLPQGFQTAEFLMGHGFVDLIVKRSNMKQTIQFLLRSSNIGNDSILENTANKHQK